MKELNDRGAQGRAYGNLGNTYYLLGNFQAAIDHHQERLKIAREFGDKAAERRANSNLGNSHIFLGQFELAVEHYKKTLSLTIELSERAVEAQACYSLGNTYTLLREFPTAIDYHQRHLAIAQELGDRVGEARACWSLGNAYSAIGNHEKALQYAQMHYLLAKELGDPVGETTARLNITDLRKILGLSDLSSDTDSVSEATIQESNTNKINVHISSTSSLSRNSRLRRQSMEQLDLIKLTPDGKRISATQNNTIHNENAIKMPKNSDDDFFEMLTKSQSKRMDDQRCSLKVVGSQNKDRKPLSQQNQNKNVPTKDNR